jgi:hypothetical protein
VDECGCALSVAGSQVTSHLREKHSAPEGLRKGLTQYLTRVYNNAFCDPASVPPWPNGSPVHPKLKEHNGFTCHECSYRTINHSEMSRHISKEHLNGWRASRSRIDDHYNDVFLQTWTHRADGVNRQYWVVKNNGSSFAPLRIGTPALIFSQYMSKNVSAWNQRSKPVHMARIQASNTPLQLGRGWNAHNGPSLIMRALTKLPSAPSYTTDHFLG